ncbi:MAG: metallophosphoesterase [Halieaceae bacterium]|jgi:hypothetical protein|nr:metallophosphoesterase [Halieaceae bacterium]
MTLSQCPESTELPPERFFVIGDSHGYLDTLVALLEKLGIRQGVFPDNTQLIFLGDLIDRGPDSAGIVHLVRTLCEAGHAQCLLANHEFNFVNYHTETAPGSGEFRRAHNAQNDAEVRETLESYQARYDDPAAAIAGDVAWFRQLPIALELAGLRAVHACWHPDHLAVFKQSGNGWYLNEDDWERAWQPETPQYEATEILCKGVEQPLPGGITFTDKNGVTRQRARVCWWNRAPERWEDFIRAPGIDLTQLPPAGRLPTSAIAPTTPTFFGHYWFSGQPRLIDRFTACLDFSVAAESGGYLAAYEFHAHDEALDPSRLHWVERAG